MYVSSSQADTQLYALDAATGAKLWTFSFFKGYPSSPVVANGVVYVDSANGRLVALDAATGRKLWFYPAGGAVYSSPAVANGMVYLASQKGPGAAFAFGL